MTAIFLQQQAEIGDAQRFAEEIALYHVAALFTQEFQLMRIFYPFGDHRQAQVVRHSDNGGRDGDVIGVAGDVLDEGAIDFECMQRETLQVGQ